MTHGPIELAVQLHVARHPDDHPPAGLQQRSHPSQRLGVVFYVLQHIDRQHRLDPLANPDRSGQVENPRLDLGSGREPGRHRRDGRGIRVGHDVALEALHLGCELAEPGAHLDHRVAEVRPQQLQLVGLVAALVGSGVVLEAASGGPGEGVAHDAGPGRGRNSRSRSR